MAGLSSQRRQQIVGTRRKYDPSFKGSASDVLKMRLARKMATQKLAGDRNRALPNHERPGMTGGPQQPATMHPYPPGGTRTIQPYPSPSKSQPAPGMHRNPPGGGTRTIQPYPPSPRPGMKDYGRGRPIRRQRGMRY